MHTILVLRKLLSWKEYFYRETETAIWFFMCVSLSSSDGSASLGTNHGTGGCRGKRLLLYGLYCGRDTYLGDVYPEDVWKNEVLKTFSLKEQLIYILICYFFCQIIVGSSHFMVKYSMPLLSPDEIQKGSE